MKRKPPSLPDFDLWAEVARGVRPLTKRRAPAIAQSTAAPPAKALAAASPPKPPRSMRREPPPLTGLDRRSERRMTRGHVEIDGRIDLHGTGIEQSRVRLYQFVSSMRTSPT